MFNGKYHNLYCIIVFDITYSSKCITEKYGKKDTTLDRIDPDKNYCKENCRWATIEEQSYNKRDTIREEIDGQLLTLKEISLKYNLPLTTLYSRYEKGYRGKKLARPYGQKIK